MTLPCSKAEHAALGRNARGACVGCRREAGARHYAKYGKPLRAKGRARIARDPEAHRTKSREAKRRQLGFPTPRYPMPALCEWPNCTRAAACLDHCHLTGVHRGWLCMRHNSGLGLIGDTDGALSAGLVYLSRVPS